MDKQTEIEKIRKMAYEIILSVNKLLSEYKTPITELGLSKRALNILMRSSIEFVEQLVVLTEDALLRLRSMGIKSLNEIKEKLKACGFDIEINRI